MTSDEFVIWLKGFIAGSNNYNLTPGGWETLKDQLEKVSDELKPVGVPIGSGGFGTIATSGYGSITYTPSTSTTYGYPSGSAWYYTNGGNEIKD